MPILDWIGKDKVVSHHLDVPYRVLEKRYSFGDAASEDMIIRGDNLDALKALLPRYEGRVKCIYIDPPYNTGNEGWVYNDRVNDPKINKWLGTVVGKEGEDLSRHDKWLCMMYPRLRLLQKLLSDDGVIFISIDDIEVFYLKLIMDEIFGKDRFLAALIWKSRQNKDNRNVSNISIDHEYVLCYGDKLRGSKRKTEQYKNPDNDPRGDWTSANMVGLATADARPNLHYDLIDPETGINYGCPHKGWRYDRNTMARLIAEKRILWPDDPNGRPRKKQFFADLSTEFTGYSSIIGESYFTRDGAKEQLEIWGEIKFDFPKNSGIVRELIEQATDKDSIILDSFAGSGTTAHAVLNMNRADGGSRKFILVEMEGYAETITAERVRRVISGYGDGKSAVPGTGGGFSFFELGEPLMNGDVLNESAGVEAIREYVWFTETRTPYIAPASGDGWYLGTCNGTAYYFCYEPGRLTTLDHDLAAHLPPEHRPCVIYADICTMDESRLASAGIVFKKIPRDIARV